MKEITSLTVGGQSYAITDPNKLPQPENPAVGNLLTVEVVEEGKVTRVGVRDDTPYFVECEWDDASGWFVLSKAYDTTIMVERLKEAKPVVCKMRTYENATLYLPAVGYYWTYTPNPEVNDGRWVVVFQGHTDEGLFRVELDPGRKRSADITVTGVLSDTDRTLTLSGWAADAKVVGDRLGDISEALDHILALQETLIGGGSR